MQNFLKPILLTSMMVLPMIGQVSALPYHPTEDNRAAIREELRVNRMQFDTAVANRNFERAAYERREIDRNLAKLGETNAGLYWDEANSEDHYLLTNPDYEYSRRTIITTPYTVITPTVTPVYPRVMRVYP